MDLNSRQESRLLVQWRSTIEELGGTWVGVQQPLVTDPVGEAIVVFIAPNAKKESKVPVSEMTRSNIVKVMGISGLEPENDTVAHLEHAAKRLRNLAKQLILTADEIEEEIECLKK
jgi:hypothetical protein